ncbi:MULTISPECIES: sensor histidine kinase [Aneurinibacillus]|uniref:histidine kinase n=1 Tax=Aneurinibacillus thermoaerophilus TaxID=143495 RepID=A0A1G8A4M3_ANETH|nr:MULTISPECIES: ATP-binding protein [Aneurinibacillus]AMA74112.1 hypothetical protein ACH33_15665 [Aneurinibacillus sp. XH2]MED0675490.1 ATP-binding protein [Aneurinibacillus thermoaerophilus]MED0678845.1 ATP-binding protein [Aneurinibacillus thermoaerophilus]MED0736718.1 ATP-binding protein [Aneurinibacillus thermoaerophilus]MED0758373.1 ATP-binding protein [Aneurinibacillus thermoaerophilus]
MDFIIFIFYSIPEMLLLIALVLTLCGQRPPTTRYIVASVLIACTNELIQLADTDMVLRAFLQLIFALVIMMMFFGLPFFRVFISLCFSLLVLQAIELVSFQFGMLITGMDYQTLREHTAFLFVIWGNLVLLLALLFFLEKIKFSLFAKESLQKPPRSQTMIYYFLAVLFYVIGMVGAELNSTGTITKSKDILIMLIFQVIFLFLMREIMRADRNEFKLKIQQEYTENVTSLFTSIRAQRHDFANHIQVLSLLLYQKQYEKAEEYLRELAKQTVTISKILIKDNAGLSALLQAKTSELAREGIQLVLDLQTNLINTTMTSIEMNQLIGNLIDNAADAIREDGYKSPEIHLHTAVHANMVYISVTNFRPIIPADLQKKIFEYGFSTKPGHSGIGLAIVKQLVKSHKGEISLASTPIAGTTFIIQLPVIEKTQEAEKVI